MFIVAIIVIVVNLFFLITVLLIRGEQVEDVSGFPSFDNT